MGWARVKYELVDRIRIGPGLVHTEPSHSIDRATLAWKPSLVFGRIGIGHPIGLSIPDYFRPRCTI